MTPGERQQVLDQLDRLIAQLAGPLPPAERAAGWTDASRVAFLAAFARLREVLAAEPPQPLPRAASLTREMDHWGISGGRLLEEAAALSLALRRLEEGAGS